MGQLLAGEQQEEQLLLTDHEEENSFSESDLPAIPIWFDRPVFGLDECRQFLDANLGQPLRYKRACIANSMVGHFNFPSLKILTLIGRQETGKQSLLMHYCKTNNIFIKTLSTPSDLIHFNVDLIMQGFDKKFNTKSLSVPTSSSSWKPWGLFGNNRPTSSSPPLIHIPESWILVVESTVIADHSGQVAGQDRSFLNAKLQYILQRYQSLPLDSSFIKIVFLLHDPSSLFTCQLQSIVNNQTSMYARVLPLQARIQLIKESLRQFYTHELMKRMSHFISFTDQSILETLAQSAAWYTPGEIGAFLDRCYNHILVKLLNYTVMAAVPGGEMIDISKIILDELKLTQGAVMARNMNQAPLHGPYSLDMQDIRLKSLSFEHFYKLEMIDVDDGHWLDMIQPLLITNHQEKRKIEQITPSLDNNILVIPPAPKRPRSSEDENTTVNGPTLVQQAHHNDDTDSMNINK